MIVILATRGREIGSSGAVISSWMVVLEVSETVWLLLVLQVRRSSLNAHGFKEWILWRRRCSMEAEDFSGSMALVKVLLVVRSISWYHGFSLSSCK